ncbi:hypothetical protein GCM10009584_05740 [Ornithinimicrobium humiphilum]|uniref:Uncharacterized protein n=1 Tax=Ornithinimicrobium humiphilum TaxID=125288 RepID=A0A543KPU5_9MICO|nr:hypothetical protein [Ornithinimicrobium humiphilum]TQM97088.1 hypothetical protein FB476_1988 [Ornithinimicrobium humiphilum]
MTTALPAPAWLAPTGRAVPWHALVAVAPVLVASAALGAAVDRTALVASDIAAAGLASAVVSGLADPAADLLDALPTRRSARRLHRLALLVPAGLTIWLAFLATALVGAGPGPGWPVGPFLALTFTGCAVAAVSPARYAVAAGAAAPLVWIVLGRAAAGLDTRGDQLLAAYQHHPWIVTLAALAALLGTGLRR